jgi:hypothetical protein
LSLCHKREVQASALNEAYNELLEIPCFMDECVPFLYVLPIARTFDLYTYMGFVTGLCLGSGEGFMET